MNMNTMDSMSKDAHKHENLEILPYVQRDVQTNIEHIHTLVRIYFALLSSFFRHLKCTVDRAMKLSEMAELGTAVMAGEVRQNINTSAWSV